jgi:chromosome segregation protein
MNKAAETRHTIRMLTNDLERLAVENSRKLREIDRITQEAEETQQQVIAVQEKVNQVIAERERQTEQIGNLVKQEQEFLQKLETGIQERDALEGQLRQIQSRLRVLEEMSRDYEGYHKGVRSVLMAARNKKLGQGICGVVSELFTTDEKYEQAIATALGATLQNIVTERSQDAESAISYLKSSQGGRCTFLPLDIIRPGRRSDLLTMLSKETGMLGSAADLVKAEDRFSDIREFLLGQILVAKDLEHAMAVAKKSQFRIRLVTLDGDMISPGGAMSGGSRVGNQASLLGRPREIEDLKEATGIKSGEVRACGAKNTDLQQKMKKIQTLIQQSQNAGQQLDEVRAEHLRQLEQLQYQQAHLDKQLTIGRLEAEEIGRLIHEAQAKEEQFVKADAMDRETTETMETEIRSLQAVLQIEMQAKEEILAKVTDNKVTLAGVRQKETGLIEQVRIQERILKGCRERTKKIQEDMQALTQRAVILSEKDIELKKLKDRFTRSKMELDNVTSQMRHERQATLGFIDQEERKLKRLRKRAADSQSEMHQLDMAAARQEMEIESHASRLQEQYHLTLEAAAGRVTVVADENEVRTTISVLKEKMTELGEVHLGAVDEQRRVQERYLIPPVPVCRS